MIPPIVHSVYELLAQQFGATLDFEENPLVTSVGVTDVTIFKNNPRRVAIVVINLSANTVYLRPGAQAAAATAGIVLVSGGGSLTMNAAEDFHLPSLEWHAIASGAASAIYSVGLFLA